jgi:hypothetical protein
VCVCVCVCIYIYIYIYIYILKLIAEDILQTEKIRELRIY